MEVQVFGVLVGAEVGQDASCAVFGGDLCRDIADDGQDLMDLGESASPRSTSDGIWRLGTTTIWAGQKGRVWWKASTWAVSATTWIEVLPLSACSQ